MARLLIAALLVVLAILAGLHLGMVLRERVVTAQVHA